MYEPIIDPMIFYWIDILEKLEDFHLSPFLEGFLVVFLFL